LIWLSKVGKISLLKDLFIEIEVSQEVYHEAVEKGLSGGFSDALAIKECFDQGWIKITRLTEAEIMQCQKIMEQNPEIDLGEMHAIVLARRKKALLLMDESSGRTFAQALGLDVRGVLYVIMLSLREKKLNNKEAKEIVYTLVGKGFRIEPRLLARVFRAIE
jgi:predicted nucleic acid-binding protein